ncbi:ABC transporter permease [Prosthecobacter vanneervenii]|uniref:Putative ABC transport system permease protein n=1 Tax=Prosthecobacter vanneervenii TaxID=48466 RepID=A0A7W7YG25_9BACT|nr:FtsX-like permease family protein [Prosthecobacter vanneervenii]MBB5035205.1 putative ABC transport system permease protein [Prosthecobacter vanneervenii]
MLTPLDLKLFRDLGRMKGQIVAVSLVMACGLAMMIMTRSIVMTLESTRDAYYQRYRLADVFASLKRAPLSLADRVAEIPGVAAVEARVVVDATLDIVGMTEPASGHLVSLPEGRSQTLNKIFIRQGRLPLPDERRHAVVSESFALANKLQIGDSLAAIINGHRDAIIICGIGLSPEFVFEARPGQTLPDNKRYGVFWMNYQAIAVPYNLDGAFNDICVDLSPGAKPGPVLAEMDRLMKDYGAQGAYTRQDHNSAKRLDDELSVVRALSVAYPVVFLSVAAFMVNAVLARLVRLQREQIAQLKALGYSSWQVGWHYLNYALVIVVLGTLAGGLIGRWAGGGLVRIYDLFFRFPALNFRMDYGALGIALVISAAASFLGVVSVVWMAVKLPPAEAMRPEPPADFKPSMLERIGLTRGSGPAFRMALRNIERRPVQALFTVFGLSLATGLMVLPGSMADSIDYLLTYQWNDVQRQDVVVFFAEPGSGDALHNVEQLPGVQRAEPVRAVQARIRFGHHYRKLAVTGLPRNADLNRLMDAERRRIVLPEEGIVMSAQLGRSLGAHIGDVVQVEALEGRRDTMQVPVRGFLEDFAGVSAFMDIEALHRLMHEGETVSGAYLTVDQSRWEEFMREVKDTPRVATTLVKQDQLESFRSTTGQSIGILRKLYLVLAIIVAFGVVYNSARIALSERSRDLATLRVIGFTQREVAGVLLGELMLLIASALPLGLLFGRGLATLIIEKVRTETVRLPLVISLHTYTLAVIVVLAASCASFLVVGRMLRQLDMVGVLKARD